MNEISPIPPDWYAIEADYRAGIKTLGAIAEAHPGINHMAIKRRAERDGWDRDLSANIRARAEAQVAKKVVAKTVAKKNLATEHAIIETNAPNI